MRFGAIAVAIGYLVFAIFWLPRLATASEIVGWRGTIGAAGGVAEQLVVIAAAAIVYASTASPGSAWAAKLTRVALWVFGLSTINFGLAQFTGIADTASMVPTWIPLGGDFWAVFTGFAFVLAGVGILCGILDLLAARLLTLMMVIFSALALAPLIVAYPHSHIAWGSNAYNLAVVGAAWILADWLADCRHRSALQAHASSSG